MSDLESGSGKAAESPAHSATGLANSGKSGGIQQAGKAECVQTDVHVKSVDASSAVCRPTDKLTNVLKENSRTLVNILRAKMKDRNEQIKSDSMWKVIVKRKPKGYPKY